MTRIGLELVREKKIQIAKAALEASKDGAQERLHGRDLLTLLVKANMASDITDSQRLSDENVLARMFSHVFYSQAAHTLSMSEVPTYVP